MVRWQLQKRLVFDPMQWKSTVRFLIKKTAERYPSTNKRHPAGLDLRLTYPFVSEDLMHADFCVQALSEADGDITGFAFVNSQNTQNLYVPLIVSLHAGVGRMLVEMLRSNPHFAQKQLVLQSTDKALGFYLRLGFVLVDWDTVSNSCSDCQTDAPLTFSLSQALSANDTESIEHIRARLIDMCWCEPDAGVWPLLIPRAELEAHRPLVESSFENNHGCRRSARLLQKK